MNQQLANLYTLLGAVQAQPEKQFDLTRYCDDTDNVCGTLFCTAGLAGTLPFFQSQGMVLAKKRWGFMVEVDGVDVDETPKTDDLFGDSAWYNLFASRGDGDRDEDIAVASRTHLTDKELAIARIEAQIEAIKLGEF